MNKPAQNIVNKESISIFDRFKIALLLIGILWVVALIDLILIDLTPYGLVPRTFSGLIGIITSPFLHADLNQNASHIINNSLFLLFLLPITIIIYEKSFTKVLIFIIVVGGSLVWIFGRYNNHIGASGLVFGLLTFLFFSGIFRRNIKSIVGSILFLLAYSIIIYGFFPKNLNEVWLVLKSVVSNFISGIAPNQPYISWEGHLFGAIAGGVAAFIFRNHKEN